MKRKPKKVLVDGEKEGVGMAVHSASSVQLCKTGIYGRTDRVLTAVFNILRSEKSGRYLLANAPRFSGRCFARLSFWEEQRVDKDECGALEQ
jgi:hypothetical protein